MGRGRVGQSVGIAGMISTLTGWRSGNCGTWGEVGLRPSSQCVFDIFLHVSHDSFAIIVCESQNGLF